MKYRIKVKDTEYEVNIHHVEDNVAVLSVNNEEFVVEVDGLAVSPTQMSIRPTPKQTAKPVQSKKPPVKNEPPKTEIEVKPPLPGVILEMCVEEGQKIKKGQVLYVLDAMKMENHIESDHDGIVDKILSTIGESVLENDTIMIIK
ncbi:MAG: biotin/lipoyl-binding protein [Tannerella sp.]|jgi:biotin carboxyl carrier protein|nr:biotin/lipoyl-binding protein [Tannerella sp.]